MKQLLEYIVPNIVNHPGDVEINETHDGDTIVLTIKVNPEDTGRVIGKAGKVIKAIRQIARIIAIKQGVRVNIDVLDGQSKGQAENFSQSETTPTEEVEEVSTEPQTIEPDEES